jgi:hypothetical protein
VKILGNLLLAIIVLAPFLFFLYVHMFIPYPYIMDDWNKIYPVLMLHNFSNMVPFLEVPIMIVCAWRRKIFPTLLALFAFIVFVAYLFGAWLTATSITP